ncbi:hypothetical protein PIB30_057960 [Stylosanthes scabra]|uniref:Uncharacterized protein n=1 Tax=Stylosanthes scabra TaxID=79078 RepID=A0ABU6ZIL0_9FABA|nr:hypothetical protein [Stylosanthes scabra]
MERKGSSRDRGCRVMLEILAEFRTDTDKCIRSQVIKTSISSLFSSHSVSPYCASSGCRHLCRSRATVVETALVLHLPPVITARRVACAFRRPCCRVVLSPCCRRPPLLSFPRHASMIPLWKLMNVAAPFCYSSSIEGKRVGTELTIQCENEDEPLRYLIKKNRKNTEGQEEIGAKKNQRKDDQR